MCQIEVLTVRPPRQWANVSVSPVHEQVYAWLSTFTASHDLYIDHQHLFPGPFIITTVNFINSHQRITSHHQHYHHRNRTITTPPHVYRFRQRLLALLLSASVLRFLLASLPCSSLPIPRCRSQVLVPRKSAFIGISVGLIKHIAHHLRGFV